MINIDNATVLPITQKELYEWLSVQEDNTIIGKRNSSCSCPVAQYCKSALSTTYVSVGTTQASLNNNNRIKLKKWQTNFITKIDALTEIMITKEKALQILREVSKRKFK